MERLVSALDNPDGQPPISIVGKRDFRLKDWKILGLSVKKLKRTVECLKVKRQKPQSQEF